MAYISYRQMKEHVNTRLHERIAFWYKKLTIKKNNSDVGRTLLAKCLCYEYYTYTTVVKRVGLELATT